MRCRWFFEVLAKMGKICLVLIGCLVIVVGLYAVQDIASGELQRIYKEWDAWIVEFRTDLKVLITALENFLTELEKVKDAIEEITKELQKQLEMMEENKETMNKVSSTLNELKILLQPQ